MKRLLKKVLFLLLFCVSTLFGEFETSGYIGLNSQSYLTLPKGKHKNNFTAKQEIKLKYTKEDFSIFANIYAQEDYYDLSNDDTKHNDRTFIRLDELYLKYDFENDMISVGKSIKFWGALEVKNIVNVFNQKDFRTDLLRSDEMGAYNFTYSHYTENGEISAILKLNEPNQPMATFKYAYYTFAPFITYEDELQKSDDNYKPSIYLSYSGTLDTEYALDYAFIYENGYDSQRYFLPDGPLDGSPVVFKQYAYTVNKFMTYNTLVIGATLIKLEALYAIVDDDKYIANYSHIAFGFEHMIENFLDSDTTLGVIAEYYKYKIYDDDKYSDLELFETMQNDLFVGLRYSLNNANDTNIIGGAIIDTEYDEQTYYMQFVSRAYDSFKIEIDYYYIEPSKDTLTPNALLGRHQRIALDISYYF